MKTITLNSPLYDLLRDEVQGLELNEILKKNTGALLSVEADQEIVLKKIGINSIFDLGTSWTFSNAKLISTFSEPGNSFYRLGLAPKDYLTSAAPETEINKLATLDLKFLQGLNQFADDIKKALSVKTIREFANWSAYDIAHKIVSLAIGNTDENIVDDAEELRPRLGDYPTHRVYYDSLVMLKTYNTEGDEANPKTDIRTSGKTLNLKSAIDKKGRLNQPAIGAIFTYSQSWFSQAITLGKLLHSLSLAPGEVTRMAVIDWNRRTSGKETETISETEKLDSEATHALAEKEVQDAVANELQAGGSQSSSSATSSSAALSASVGTGFLSSLFVDADVSASGQMASTSSQAESSSWSMGHRGVSADMGKFINDRTEQHSASARSRRAAIVKEVSQSEHEQVSTRIVANYNHMHALTVQYYEVVQIYRTVTELHKLERCLFLPMDIIDFSDDNVIDRYRIALMFGALNRTIRDTLFDDTSSVILIPKVKPKTFITATRYSPALDTINEKTEPTSSTTNNASLSRTLASSAINSNSFSVAPQPFWSNDVLLGISRNVNKPILHPDSDGLYFPDNLQLIRISFSPELKVKRVNLYSNDTGDKFFDVGTDQYSVSVGEVINLVNFDKIQLQKTDASNALDGVMILTCVLNGGSFTLPIPVSEGNVSGLTDVLTITTDKQDRIRDLKKHLIANADYYSRIIYRNLDSATITLLLGDYEWNGKPLLDMVEPRPYKVIGNYLILKAPVDQDVKDGDENLKEWNQIIDEKAIKTGETDERLVPMPTGGVFAEAVLGRSNSAEKLDITRFWNWQDSPIPILPSEISPIDTSSRGTTEDLKPGQLSSPVLNIVNPTNLPTGSDLGGILSAVSNGNMFRDMSGLVGTQGLVKTGMDQTLQAATDAGQINSENMKTEAQKAVAMGQIAADIVKSVMGGGAGDSSVTGISAEGAKINHAKSLDDRGIPPSSGGVSTSDGSSGGEKTSPQNNGAKVDTVNSTTSGNNESIAHEYAVKGRNGVITDKVVNKAMPSAPKGTSTKKIFFLANDANKNLVEFVIKATVYDGRKKMFEGEFRGSDVAEVTFDTPSPFLSIKLECAGGDLVFGNFTSHIPKINKQSAAKEIDASHNNITVTLTQVTTTKYYEVKTKEELEEKLTDDFGVSLGFKKEDAGEILGKYGHETGTTKSAGGETLTKYQVLIPTDEFSLEVV